MKSLMAINSKFFKLPPKELVSLINSYTYTKGVEVFIDIDKNDEINYLKDLVPLLKQYNLILQIHSKIDIDLNLQLKFFELLEHFSTYLGYPIKVTLHSIYSTSKEKSYLLTNKYIYNLLNSIDNSKIIICLENLNEFGSKSDLVRLDKDNIRDIIIRNKDLFFTYDIGHVIALREDPTKLNCELYPFLKNVHIHSCDVPQNDHKPILNGDIHLLELKKAISNLKNHHYNENIVFEYNLDDCLGNSYTDKIKYYLKSINSFSEKYL